MDDAGTTIEIQLTPRYDRAKRNLIFIAVVMIAIAIADRRDTRIPGLGDAAMPTWAALFGLGIALIYCVDGFWREFAFAAARNSSFAEGRSPDDLGAAFRSRDQSLHQFADYVAKVAETLDPEKSSRNLTWQMEQIDVGLRAVLAETERIALAASGVQKAAEQLEYAGKPSPDEPGYREMRGDLEKRYQALLQLVPSSATLPPNLRDAVSRIETAADGLKTVFNNILVSSQEVSERVHELTLVDRDLLKGLSTLSDGVFRSHRTSFRHIDRIAIGVVLPAAAAISMIGRLLYQYAPCC